MLNWRARHVGMMHFGVFSVTETQLMAIGVLIATGVFRCDFWNYDIIPGLIDAKAIVYTILLFFGFYTMYGEYLAVDEYYKKNKNKQDPGKWYEIGHMLLFVSGFVCWNLVGVFEDYPWSYIWICAFVFCGIIHRLIVADVAHMKTDKYYMLLLPLFLMIFGSIGECIMGISKSKSFMNSAIMVYGIFGYVLIFWSAYVLKVIDEICDTLDIRLFVITNKDKKKSK